jgi:1,4-dihydroxy-2-naphthoate octaprenyltransferase
VATGLFPLWTLLALATLPLVYRILVTTRRYYDDVARFAPAIMLTVQTFALSTVLFGVGLVLGRVV